MVCEWEEEGEGRGKRGKGEGKPWMAQRGVTETFCVGFVK